MEIRFSKEIVKELKKIKKYDPILLKQIEKKLILFRTNINHNSLRLHKLSGELDNLWSISINMSIRMVYVKISENEAYFVNIGTHDEVYR